MKNIRLFLSENFPFLVVKFSIYLNRRVFVMGFYNTDFRYNTVSCTFKALPTCKSNHRMKICDICLLFFFFSERKA